MDRPAKRFTPYEFVWNTTMANEQANKALKLAEALTNDPEREKRLERHECKACFYGGRVYGRLAGAACTTQPCACCDKPQTYGSTATDALCLPCAKEGDLCKRCMGDIDMRSKRRKWPEKKFAEEQQK